MVRLGYISYLALRYFPMFLSREIERKFENTSTDKSVFQMGGRSGEKWGGGVKNLVILVIIRKKFNF